MVSGADADCSLMPGSYQAGSRKNLSAGSGPGTDPPDSPGLRGRNGPMGKK